MILPRCRFVYAHTFLTFLSNWSRDIIHPINGLDSSCKPHVTRAYQSVVWKILEWKHVSRVSSSMGTTVWTFLRAGKLYITERRGPSTNVSYFHYRSGLVSCCFADSTCHQPVMAASSLQAAMRNLSTCERDKGRHLVTAVRTSKPYLGQDVNVYDKYLGQRPIKVKSSTCQRSGMNARLPLLIAQGWFSHAHTHTHTHSHTSNPRFRPVDKS